MHHHAEIPDGLPNGPVRGRGANLNPANRFESIRLHVLRESFDDGSPRQVPTEVFADQSRTVINPVTSDDLNFRWTINPYRGCEHGCIYCYARPGHEYLGLSCGLDFETRIMAKTDVATLLRQELMRPAWKGEPIMISGVTDPYQPIERDMKLTRACLEVMHEFRQCVSLITKNALITRDVDVLSDMASRWQTRVAISITTLDNRLASRMEPRASAPQARLDAVRTLSQAGVPVIVMVAPVIPGLNDAEIPDILSQSRQAGATGAGYVLLRLPFQVKALFVEWLERHFPDRAAKVLSLLRQCRGGELYDSTPGERLVGTGPIATNINATFNLFRKREGLDTDHAPLDASSFRRPPRPGETPSLFGP
jgi:DNA repair photolyase